jgi:hypothetical protein
MTRDRHQSSQPVRKYRGETVFGWEDDSAQDTSRAFTDTATEPRPGAHGALSSRASLQAQRRRMARRRRGAAALWITLVLVALVGAAAVLVLRHGLRP